MDHEFVIVKRESADRRPERAATGAGGVAGTFSERADVDACARLAAGAAGADACRLAATGAEGARWLPRSSKPCGRRRSRRRWVRLPCALATDFLIITRRMLNGR